MAQVINGYGLIDDMVTAEIVPPNCRRAILDIEVNEAVKLYYECYGDETLLEIDFAKHLSPIVKEKKRTEKPIK